MSYYSNNVNEEFKRVTAMSQGNRADKRINDIVDQETYRKNSKKPRIVHVKTITAPKTSQGNNLPLNEIQNYTDREMQLYIAGKFVCSK